MSRSRRGRKNVRRCHLWDVWDNRDQTANVERRTLELMLPTDPMAWDHSDEDAKEIAADMAAMDAETWFEVPDLTEEEEAEILAEVA